MSSEHQGADEETPVERVEERLHEAAEEVEEAAWETIYEAKDVAKDAIDSVIHPGHRRHHAADTEHRED
ncbi:MAG TPA: hypothetical protein VHF06_37390 [Pseudonocardiaceae bacterium]|jgi:hypothetical protein|nr:hypothetical protein [Pseudonocardiaceae bacterium]